MIEYASTYSGDTPQTLRKSRHWDTEPMHHSLRFAFIVLAHNNNNYNNNNPLVQGVHYRAEGLQMHLQLH